MLCQSPQKLQYQERKAGSQVVQGKG